MASKFLLEVWNRGYGLQRVRFALREESSSSTHPSFSNAKRLNCPLISHGVLKGMEPCVVQIPKPPVCHVINGHLHSAFGESTI